MNISPSSTSEYMQLVYNITTKMRNRIRERGFVYLIKRIIYKFLKFFIEKRTIIIHKRDLCYDPPQEMTIPWVGKLDLLVCDKLLTSDSSYMLQIKETSELSQREIEDRFHNGDICFLVKDENGTLAHFSWVCFKKRYIEHVDYLLKLKEDEASVYNCYTFEKYRGFSIYPWALTNIQKFLKIKGIRNVYIEISMSNVASIMGAKKAGFMAIANIKYVCVFKVIKFKKRVENKA